MANKKIKHVIAKILGEDTTETLDIYDESALHAENVKNDLTTTEEGYALDARQGKALKDHVNTLDTRIEMIGNKSYRQNVTTLRTSILAGKNTKLVSFTVSKKGRYIFRPYCRINSMDKTHAVWFYVSSTEPSANILYYWEAVAYSPVPASGVFQGNGGIALIDLNPDTTYYMWGYCAVEITIVNPQWFSLHCLRYL